MLESKTSFSECRNATLVLLQLPCVGRLLPGDASSTLYGYLQVLVKGISQTGPTFVCEQHNCPTPTRMCTKGQIPHKWVSSHSCFHTKSWSPGMRTRSLAKSQWEYYQLISLKDPISKHPAIHHQFNCI